jgi:5,5'-dehydrodivanillate O-demethylase oxygenase subunit
MESAGLQYAWLSDVAAGTKMGALLRSYWQATAISSEVAPRIARPVEILGESLVLFRKSDESLALLDRRCPHRGASLAYGIVEETGIRCPYHGWLFASDGNCLEQPSEDPDHGFYRRVRQQSYPVREAGGLIFAYLGELPAPPLPMFDLLTEADVERRIRTAILPVNWLQIAENGFDPTHLEWLHGHLANYLAGLADRPPKFEIARHETIQFDITDLGVVKRRLISGQTEDDEDWRIGQLIMFPSTLYISSTRQGALHFRVPLDRTRTWHIWYECLPADPVRSGMISTEVAPVFGPLTGDFDLTTIDGQDVMAWVSQGPVHDRSREWLGSADKGIILFRRLLSAQAEAVARGERPRWSDLGEDKIVLPWRTGGTPILKDLPR